MILELTDIADDAVLVNSQHIAAIQKVQAVTRISFASKDNILVVKETIEEIKQQIKAGGIR